MQFKRMYAPHVLPPPNLPHLFYYAFVLYDLGYPTIYLVPAKANATPIKYDGQREVAGMKRFIKKNALA